MYTMLTDNENKPSFQFQRDPDVWRLIFAHQPDIEIFAHIFKMSKYFNGVAVRHVTLMRLKDIASRTWHTS